MALTPGTRLGAYEVVSLLGQGGMGEVYRATDTNLKRQVAIKVLPASVSSDPDRLARFQREAEVLAALNHPNIAHIHGLERADGTLALVMELVDGPTLADRIAQGPIPVAEALPIAKQIAEALEAAHERGIIHRDLKPANIKVRDDGTVKVLDFGLAKALDREAASGTAGNQSLSPTITTPAMTQAGIILGTAAYMSPEQARGRPVDRRTDVWAFGCVLYEMLSGRRAFEGEDVTVTLARVVERDPDWGALPQTTPWLVKRLLRRCLEKDRKQRLESAADARLEIQDALTSSADVPAPGVAGAGPSRVPWRAWPLAGVTVAALLGLAGLAAVHFREVPPVALLVRSEITTSAATALIVLGGDRDLAITPDGRHVIYRGQEQLLVRALDALEPTSLKGLGNAHGLFVSPDGHWVGFFDRGVSLRKVALTGGAPVTVTTLSGGAPNGATWLPDDTIVYATTDPATGLLRVPAAGGDPVSLTAPDHANGEADHVFPEALPGSDAVLFTITATTGGLEAAQIAVLDLRTKTQTVVLRGGHHAFYMPSGHLVYGRGGTLLAVPFDLQRRMVTGTPVPVIESVAMTRYGAVDAVGSTTGTLVYVRNSTLENAKRALVWVDRQGRETPIPAPPRAYENPRLSPDGTRIAVASRDQEQDIWVWDVGHTTLTRLTFEAGLDGSPVWTPDGRRLVFASQVGQTGGSNLYEQAADGTGAAVKLAQDTAVKIPTDVTPDGTQVIFRERGSERNNYDLRLLTRPGAGATSAAPPTVPLVETRFNELQGVVSPDGHWLAYAADNSGQFEVYVRPFPKVDGGLWQISTGGGSQPLWARTGRELYYRALDGAVMAVTVSPTADAWQAGTPTRILTGTYLTSEGSRQYDVSADGRFLMIKETAPATPGPTSLTLVQNWLEELKRLAPAK